MYKVSRIQEDLFELIPQEEFDNYVCKGENLLKEISLEYKECLEDYIDSEGEFNITNLEKDWFANVKADIFLSHSHNDIGKATAFAGYIFEKTGLKIFIDSHIWGDINDFIGKLKDKYANHPYLDNTYNCRPCSIISQSIGSVLTIALNKMIDTTDIVLFLETPNSIKIDKKTVKEEINTYSPWIYQELSMIRTMEKNEPDYMECTNIKISCESVMNKSAVGPKFKPKFKLNFQDLPLILKTDLESWLNPIKTDSTNSINEEMFDKLEKEEQKLVLFFLMLKDVESKKNDLLY